MSGFKQTECRQHDRGTFSTRLVKAGKNGKMEQRLPASVVIRSATGLTEMKSILTREVRHAE